MNSNLYSPLQRYALAQKLPKRYAANRRFKVYGRLSLLLALAFLATLLLGVTLRALPAFYKNQIGLDVSFRSELVSQRHCRLFPLLQKSFSKLLPQASAEEIAEVQSLVSPSACRTILAHLRSHPEDQGHTFRLWLPLSDEGNVFLNRKGLARAGQKYQRLSPNYVQTLEKIEHEGRIRALFNSTFFTGSDARDPEYAGIAGALVGSFYVILIALAFAFPLGIGAAIYLEEFGKKTRLSSWIEVSISNLAAVPSIIFGLLGLALFLGILKIPRSSALAGGLTLGLMTLPTLIITSRSALAAVPKSLRYGAQALGASPMQVMFHHVLPLGMPGILTGAIIATARALGETAPLLMIGMMAFIGDTPASPLDPASTLPVQIFTWSRNPESGFVAHTAAAILVLLGFIVVMNLGALILRRKFERQW